MAGDPLYRYDTSEFDPVFEPYEIGSIAFMTGTILHSSPGAPSGLHIIDDAWADRAFRPSVPIPDPDPPFPGWDPNAQSVQFVDENGAIGLVAAYEHIAICDDLELDADDFGWQTAAVVSPDAPPILRSTMAETLRIGELEAEVARLRREFDIRRTSSHVPVAAPPPKAAEPWGSRPPYGTPPYTAAPRPLIGTWVGDPVFGPEAGGYPAAVTHDDNVDAVSMSLSKMVRKAVGLDK